MKRPFFSIFALVLSACAMGCGGTPAPPVTTPPAPHVYAMTLQVTGMPCFAQASIDTTGDGTANPSTFLQGGFFLVTFNATGSGATMGVSGFFDPAAKTVQFPLYVISDSTCGVTDGVAAFTRS